MTSMPLEDDSTFRGNRVIIFTIIWIPVQIICIALRYVARWMIKGPWLTASGAVKYGGAGHHLAYLEKHHPDQVAIWFKHLLALAAIYWVAVNLPKIAILCLYHRLFIAKWTRVISIVMFVLIGTTIATFTVNFAEFKTFAANWDASIPATWIDRNAFYIWTRILLPILPFWPYRYLWYGIFMHLGVQR
ncbi:hypothetical protein NHQ30_011620 [Ciborinia camelliae]|nr:hypothetical protein NHQ30_011620 [Ciborinia camelliae]